MKIFIVLIMLCCSFNALSSDIILSYNVKLDSKNLEKISEKFEIVKKTDTSFEVYVEAHNVGYFLSLEPNANLVSRNIHAAYNTHEFSSSYKNFNEVEIYLKNLVQKYPKILSLEIYGQSKSKRNLYALRIDTKITNETKPEIMITAATHGDELMPVEVLLTFLEESLAKYGTDPRITKILDEKTFYIIPVVSPDSFESRSRYVEGADPNRSYPWPLNISNKPVSIIESLITFFHRHKFIATLDLHAYGKLVMYPWGYTNIAPTSNSDVSMMNDLVGEMSKENDYVHGQISTTIYIAKGSSADYYYWKNNTKAIAVEIGDDKAPPISKLPKYLNESREMLLTFFEYKY